MTSPWSSVLTSSPGMTIEVARARASSTASSAPPKTLWSVTAMPPSPIASAWSTQILGRDRAVVRPLGMHVEVDRDPVAIRERDRRARCAERGACARASSRSASSSARDRLEALALRALCGALERPAPARGAGSATRRSASRLGSVDRPVDGCAPGRPPPRVRVVLLRPVPRRRSPRPASASDPLLRSCAWSGRARESGAGRGIAGRKPSGFVWSSVASQSGELVEEPEESACRRAYRRPRARCAMTSRLAPAWRIVDVHAERNDDGTRPRSARSPPLRSRSKSRGARRRACAKAIAAGTPRGVDQTVDGEERRRRQRVRRREREVGEAREARLEAVHDCRSGPCVSASRRFAGTATGTPMFVRRESGIDGPTAMTSASSAPRWKRSAPGQQVAPATRARGSSPRCAEARAAPRGSVDVRVHLVRLRPRERRDEADRGDSLSASLHLPFPAELDASLARGARRAPAGSAIPRAPPQVRCRPAQRDEPVRQAGEDPQEVRSPVRRRSRETASSGPTQLPALPRPTRGADGRRAKPRASRRVRARARAALPIPSRLARRRARPDQYDRRQGRQPAADRRPAEHACTPLASARPATSSPAYRAPPACRGSGRPDPARDCGESDQRGGDEARRRADPERPASRPASRLRCRPLGEPRS